MSAHELSDELLETVGALRGRDLSVVELAGGLTNRNYKVTTDEATGHIAAALFSGPPGDLVEFCQRLARRATTGLAWVGGIGGNGSGDIFLAFSTGNHVRPGEALSDVQMLAPDAMTDLFQAAAEATEEAILNAMCMAETMTGRDGRVIHALPLDHLQAVMRRWRPEGAGKD